MGADITFFTTGGNAQGLVFPTLDNQWLTVELIDKKLIEAQLSGYYIEKQALEDLLRMQQHLRQPTPVRLLPKESTKLYVEIAPDAMKAWLTVTPPDHMHTDMEFPVIGELHQAITNAGVVFGINDTVLQEINENYQWGERVVVAEGQTPEHGKDAWFEPLVNIPSTIAPKLLEDGSVDFHELGAIVTVGRGEALMRHHPPTRGIFGKTVAGKSLPANDGVDKPFGLNHTVEISAQDPHLLISTVEGQPTFKHDTCYIRQVLTLDAVDLNTGNIDFNGSLVIQRNIEPGFIVKAKGDLTVYGNIDDSEVYVQGQLRVFGGIIGENAKVKVYGPIEVQFIENAMVESYGAIRVADAIVHSQVTSFGSVQVGFLPGGKHGTVVGGHLRALRKIWAHNLGSPAGTRTMVEVGTYPYLLEKHQQLQKELINKQTSFYEVKAGLMANTGPLHPKVLEYLEDQWQQLELEIETLESSLNTIAAEIENQLRSSGRIIVMNTIFAGVHLTINRAKSQKINRKTFSETTIGGTYYVRNHQIEQSVLEKYYLDAEMPHTPPPTADLR